MQSSESEQEIDFLITQEKQKTKQAENSQDKMSFNLSVTVKNSSSKQTPLHTYPSILENVSPNTFSGCDSDDFFDNFDKYYKIQGITPIKHTIDLFSPEKSGDQIKNILLSKRTNCRDENINTNNLNSHKEKQMRFHKKQAVQNTQKGDSKNRLKQILKDRTLKSIINSQNTHEIIKINNISPLLIGRKSKAESRKNTPLLHLSKQSKTISNTRKNNSAAVFKRVPNYSNYPSSIFSGKNKVNDLFKPAESWKQMQNTRPESRQFNIYKKSKVLKKRPSNHSWGQNICIVSPKLGCIRI